VIVFDLDGTLVDSRRDLADSINQVLREYRAPTLSEREVTSMVGEGARVLVERALATSGLPPEEAPRALGRFLHIYDEHLLDSTLPYAGIPELLDRLHKSARMAVLTNKPTGASVRILEGLGLRRYFSEVIGGDSTYPRKPDPAALWHLTGLLGAARERTWMIGDSRVDLETAKNAGVRCCLVRYGFGFRFEPGEIDDDVAVVDTPEEIGEVVRETEVRGSRLTG
jgi:phosphoglycolate phosphatase